MPQSTLGKVADGALWMLLFKLVERSLGLVSTLVLVRMLTPGDFGIVAMAMAVVALVELMAAFGFDVALIQSRDARRETYDTAWTLGLLFGSAVTLLLFALSPFVAAYYREPAVLPVVLALALLPLVTSLQNIGVVAFRKELQFEREFRFQVTRKLVGFCVTIPLAYWLRSYWALIAGTLAAQTFATLYSYRLHPFRPRLSLVERSGLMGFSKWLLLNNFVGFLKDRTPDLLIGRICGPRELGLYTISDELASMPTTELSAPINRALLPGFAKLSDQRDPLRTIYVGALSVLLLVAMPAAAGIFAIAPLMVPVVLGPNWIEAEPVIQILALSGALMVVQSSVCTLLVGTGHPRDVTLSNLLFATALVAMLLVLTPAFGLVGAAFATLIAECLSTPFLLWLLRRRLGIGYRVFVAAAARPLIGAATMVLVVQAIVAAVPADAPLLASAAWLIGSVLAGAATYAAATMVTWLAAGRPDGGERIVLRRLRALVSTRIRSASTDAE
jgi:O-antigen/teichoic acid export membrane protein